MLGLIVTLRCAVLLNLKISGAVYFNFLAKLFFPGVSICFVQLGRFNKEVSHSLDDFNAKKTFGSRRLLILENTIWKLFTSSEKEEDERVEARKADCS